MKTNSNKNKIEEDKLIIDPFSEFIDYMKKLVKQKGISKRDVFYLSDIPVNYGYKLLLGEKRTKQRDIIIRICFCSKFDINELQEALRLYEMPELYLRIKRDKMIAEAFKKELKNIDAFNEFLIKNNVEPLKSCGEDKDI